MRIRIGLGANSITYRLDGMYGDKKEAHILKVNFQTSHPIRKRISDLFKKIPNFYGKTVHVNIAYCRYNYVRLWYIYLYAIYVCNLYV